MTGGGSAPTGQIAAKTINLTTGGATGSIGTNSRPIQTLVPASSNVKLTGGTGGIYFTDWGSPVTLTGAVASGAGNIRVVTANVGGHDLTVTGAVTTGSGSIYLAADDNFALTAPIGGAGFSGTVYLAGNRDTGEQPSISR